MSSGGKNINGQKSIDQLWDAAEAGDILTVKKLLNAGAIIDSRNAHEETPLHQAVYNGNVKMVKLLLEQGADVNAIDVAGNTPLHYVIINYWAIKSKEIAITLLLNDAKTDIKNKKGKTPFSLVKSNSNISRGDVIYRIFSTAKKGNINDDEKKTLILAEISRIPNQLEKITNRLIDIAYFASKRLLSFIFLLLFIIVPVVMIVILFPKFVLSYLGFSKIYDSGEGWAIVIFVTIVLGVFINERFVFIRKILSWYNNVLEKFNIDIGE